MKAFVTGGTGFIGRRVVQRLIERDFEVTCLARSLDRASELREIGATIVQGDVTDKDTVREGMSDADVVFHIAGVYKVGLSPTAQKRTEQINVGGTENVLALAAELGIPKAIYTSTAAVLGDTYGIVVDETHQRDSSFDSAYDRSKYQAHQIAERHIAQGVPIIIVMPTGVYGPGDHSMIGLFVRLLLRRMAPILPGADTGWSFVHVDDVAEGHVLAAEKGQVGQTYILGGDVMTFGDALQVVARLAGVPAPLLFVKSSWIRPLWPLATWLERFIPLPVLISSEVLQSVGRTWWVSCAKAERELGYTHRSIEEGMAETVIWEVTQLQDQPAIVSSKTLLILAAAALTVGVILLQGRRKHK